MTRYNHFAPEKYPRIGFGSVGIGEKFRANKWDGKKARRNIVMVKTGELSYMELKSKKEYTAINIEFDVYSYNN